VRGVQRMPKAEEVATSVARRCFISKVHVDSSLFVGFCSLLQRLRISEPMYGDQVFLIMHYHLALVTQNLDKQPKRFPSQEFF
jgi:hypothetical protein